MTGKDQHHRAIGDLPDAGTDDRMVATRLRTETEAPDRPRSRFARVGGAGNPGRLLLGIVEGTASDEVSERDAAARRTLVLADVLAALIALAVAIGLIGDDRLKLASFSLIPLVVLSARIMGLYERDANVLSKTTLHEGPAVFHLATLYALIMYIGQPIFIDGKIGTAQGAGLWASFLVTTMGCRSLVRRLAVRHAPAERCLVLSDAPEADRLREKLAHGRALNADIVLAIRPNDLPAGPASGAVLMGLLRDHRIQRVIVATQELDTERLLGIIRDTKALGIKVSVKPRLLDVVGSAVDFDEVHGDVFLGVRRFGLTRPERRTKRLMDMTGALLALLVAAPLFAIFALAIKVDSRGPVFFRQIRVGRDGRRFRIWKFRTMTLDAEQRRAELAEHNEAGEGLFKMAADPRVTRVGRFLRRTSLDELPQLFNVLAGEMSLVGPRPLIVAEDERIEGWHRRRLHLTPGMTGMWQVMGSARIPMQEMVALDYLYIVNWSVWNDVQILLRTVAFVLGRRGL